MIVEDDYDSEYRYVGAPLPALQGLANGVAAVYLGTFSKVMFPSLRIGYAIVPEQLIKPFASAKWLADRQTPLLEQAALADFIREGHLERHVRRMRRIYGRRREVMLESLGRHFGANAAFSGDAAGMHMLVRLEEPAILARATRNKVMLTDSAVSYLTDPPNNEYVFAFSTAFRAVNSLRRVATGVAAGAPRLINTPPRTKSKEKYCIATNPVVYLILRWPKVVASGPKWKSKQDRRR